jgi:hypothetical protein
MVRVNAGLCVVMFKVNDGPCVGMVGVSDGRYFLNDLEVRKERDLIDISSVDMKKTTKPSQSRYPMSWLGLEPSTSRICVLPLQ